MVKTGNQFATSYSPIDRSVVLVIVTPVHLSIDKNSSRSLDALEFRRSLRIVVAATPFRERHIRSTDDFSRLLSRDFSFSASIPSRFDSSVQRDVTLSSSGFRLAISKSRRRLRGIKRSGATIVFSWLHAPRTERRVERCR